MRGRLTAAALFPLVIWFAAAFFYFGDLGSWNDDYPLDHRDLPGGAWTMPIRAMMPPYFSRPLYFLIVPPLQTALANHLWINHLLGALAHALTAFLLWRLARALELPHRAATAAGVLFLACPIFWEVPFWWSAMPTALAASSAILLCLAFLGYVRREIGGWGVILVGALAFVIPCFNEQAATLAPALPLLAWSAGVPPRSRRSVAGTLVSLAAIAVYLASYIGTAPHGARGSSGSFTHSAEVRAKLLELAQQSRDYFLMRRGFAPGAFWSGIRAVRDRPVETAVLLAAAIAFAWPWLRRWMSAPGTPPAQQRRLVRVAVTGIAFFLLGWVPNLLIRSQSIEPRLCYWPAAALLLAIGAAGAALASCAGEPRLGRAAAGSLVVSASMAGAVMLIGVQSQLRNRWRMDLDQARQFRELLPDPAPGTIFVPLRLDDFPGRSGRRDFDDLAVGPFERPWAGPFYLRRAFDRPDLVATWWTRAVSWRPRFAADSRGLLYDDSLLHTWDAIGAGFERDASGAHIFPWDRVVPFIVDGDGRVRLVGLCVDQRDLGRAEAPEPGAEPVYVVPQVARLRGLHPGDVVTARLRPGPGKVAIDWAGPETAR